MISPNTHDLIRNANAAIFAIEETLPIETDTRHRFFLARIALAEAKTFLANAKRLEEEAELDRHIPTPEIERRD